MKVHASRSSDSNKRLEYLKREPNDEGNVQWVERALRIDPPHDASIILVGGANLSHFRIRVAQSHARRDLLPSYWSHVAILDDGNGLHEVSLEPPGGFKDLPKSQGIRPGKLRDYNNTDQFPNVALLSFNLSKDSLDGAFDKTVKEIIGRLHNDRGRVDFLLALWTWLGFIWGAGDQPNPLLQDVGIPSAIMVETVFSIIGVDLTPGLASQSSCPEAIWQAVKWWGDYYDSEAALTSGQPYGHYCVDQPAAAVTFEGG